MRKPKSDKERVQSNYFTWLLGKRNGTYYADGRGNQPRLGRFSLGVRDRAAAMTNLAELDRVKAVEADLVARQDSDVIVLSLADGWQLYQDFYR